MNIRISLLGTALVLVFLSKPTFAFDYDLTEALDSIQKLDEKVLDRGTLDELLKFKSEVEKNALAVTLKLCIGYRLAIGLGLPYKLSLSDQARLQLESLNAWQEIYRHGLVLGLGFDLDTARFNSFKGADWYSKEYWFESRYAIYLLNSPGFMRGAYHCLDFYNEPNVRRLNSFAASILWADLFGTMVSYEAPFLVPAGALARAGRLAARIPYLTKTLERVKVPTVKLINLIKSRSWVVFSLQSLTFVFTFLTADNAIQIAAAQQLAQDQGLTLISPGNQTPQMRLAHDRQIRFNLLNPAYEILRELSRMTSDQKSDQNSDGSKTYTQKTAELFGLLAIPAIQNQVPVFVSDYVDLNARRKGKATLDRFETGYLALLEVMRPNIDEVRKLLNLPQVVWQ